MDALLNSVCKELYLAIEAMERAESTLANIGIERGDERRWAGVVRALNDERAKMEQRVENLQHVADGECKAPMST